MTTRRVLSCTGKTEEEMKHNEPSPAENRSQEQGGLRRVKYAYDLTCLSKSWSLVNSTVGHEA